MYAIIQASGRQVRVSPGGVVTLDGTAGDPGAKVTLGEVLLVEKDGGEVLAGAPFVANAKVIAVVEGTPRGLHAGEDQGHRRLGIAAMAHKKGQGSSRNGRDSNSQRLGTKA